MNFINNIIIIGLISFCIGCSQIKNNEITSEYNFNCTQISQYFTRCTNSEVICYIYRKQQNMACIRQEKKPTYIKLKE